MAATWPFSCHLRAPEKPKAKEPPPLPPEPAEPEKPEKPKEKEQIGWLPVRSPASLRRPF